MRRSDKPVLLVSNDLLYKNNTLTDFSGSIVTDFLNENKSWKVAVHSCGLHFMLKQPIASKYENHPSLIQINFGNLNKAIKRRDLPVDKSKFELWMFESGYKFFVDREKSYTQRSLFEDLWFQMALNRKPDGKFDGFPCKYDRQNEVISFGQFDPTGEDSNQRLSKLPFSEGRLLRTFVFINARFREGLKIEPFHNLTPTEINGEPYYYFFNHQSFATRAAKTVAGSSLAQETGEGNLDDGSICASVEKDFPLREPQIIQITSSDIEPNINSGIFCRSLCQFTVKRSEIKKRVNKEFKIHQFSDVLNNCITKFSIKFVDEELDELHLTRGLPSWVLLLFSPEMDNKRNVMTSSAPTDLYPENNMSNFSVELKQTIDFSMTDNPKVGLTSLSFKNKWKIMPRLKLNISILDCEEGLTDVNVNVNCEFRKFDCPRGNGELRNCEDIVKWCKKLLKDEFSIEMEKRNTGNLSMTFPNRKYLMIIGSDLVQILGLSYLHKNSEDLFSDLKKNNGGSRGVKAGRKISRLVKVAMARYIMDRYKMSAEEKPFESTGDVAIYCDSQLSIDIALPPREIQLYPSEFYIYSNIVEPWSVMGEYRKLLKIVAIKQDEYDENVTIDFHKPEYHILSEHHPRKLQFQISTGEDALIEPFSENERMYISLQFSYN